MLNYDIYSKEFPKLQPTRGGTISNRENGQMVYIYSAYVMHFQIFIITWYLYLLHHKHVLHLYGADDVSM